MPEPGTAIHFTVRMIPTAKGRPRAFVRNGHARAYTPAKTDQAERDFIALADQHAPAAPLEGPLELKIEFRMPIPPSWSGKRQRLALWHISRPDLDNLVKLVTDALGRSGRWWRDDAQLARIIAAKVYSSAGAEIAIGIEPLAGGLL